MVSTLFDIGEYNQFSHDLYSGYVSMCMFRHTLILYPVILHVEVVNVWFQKCLLAVEEPIAWWRLWNNEILYINLKTTHTYIYTLTTYTPTQRNTDKNYGYE